MKNKRITHYLFIMEEKILHIPSFEVFDNDWSLLQSFLRRRGFPKWSFMGDLNLSYTDIKSLVSLQSVGGFLNLSGTKIKSLGSLRSVGHYLNLRDTEIKNLGSLEIVHYNLILSDTPLKSFGLLKYVGGYLDLENTPISGSMREEDIRSKIKVDGVIYL